MRFGVNLTAVEDKPKEKNMAIISIKQLLEAGVHFGHHTRRWNPKMAEYIFTERNGIYIIDLQKTVKKFEEAYMYVRDLAAEGGTVLFVGTKKHWPPTLLRKRLPVQVCTMSTTVGPAVCSLTSRP